MNQVRRPDVLRELNGCTGKLCEAFRIVREIAVFVAVEPIAIKIKRIIQEEVSDATMNGTATHGGKTQAHALRKGHTLHHDGVCLDALVTRQKDGHVVSQFHERPGQSVKDIGKATGFGIWQRFGGYKEYAHEQRNFLRYRTLAQASSWSIPE